MPDKESTTNEWLRQRLEESQREVEKLSNDPNAGLADPVGDRIRKDVHDRLDPVKRERSKAFEEWALLNSSMSLGNNRLRHIFEDAASMMEDEIDAVTPQEMLGPFFSNRERKHHKWLGHGGLPSHSMVHNIYHRGAIQGKPVSLPGGGSVSDLTQFVSRVNHDRLDYNRNWIQFQRAMENQELTGTLLQRADDRAGDLTMPSQGPVFNPKGGPPMDLRLSGPLIGDLGRNGDTEIAHLTPGEVVIPREVAAKLQSQIQTIMNKPNLDEMTVGKGKINPETGLEEFWQSGYLSDEADESGRRAYSMHWSDYDKWALYRKYGTRARNLTGKYKTDEYWEDKDILGNIGKLDPEGDFTAKERKSYDTLSKRLFYAHAAGRGFKDASDVTDALGISSPVKGEDESWTDYRKRQRDVLNYRRQVTRRTAGSWGHHMNNLRNEMNRWERKRNTRIRKATEERMRLEEEALIREQEHEMGVQRAMGIRTKRKYAEAMGRIDEGKITARGEAVQTDNPASYQNPKYTTRARRTKKISNVGFFFNI